MEKLVLKGKSCCYRECTLSVYVCWTLIGARGGRWCIYIFIVLH